MTEEELRKLLRIKMSESNLQKHITDIANSICEAYEKGFNDGFEIAQKIK